MMAIREDIQMAFQNWKGNENGFSKDVLVPLLERMGFRDPHFTGGEKEKGIDVLYHEFIAPEDMSRFTGIQVKLEDITARASGGINPTSLEPQIRQAFEKEVGFRGYNAFTRISSLVICNTGRITLDARKEIEQGTHGERRLGAPIRFWEGSDLASFIERYWLDQFAQLAGLSLPSGLRQLIVQGDSLATGMALAKAGQTAAAIPLLQDSLWNAALWLGTAHFLENRHPEEMLRAAKTLIEFDKTHYNQFWLAGYAEFRLGRYPDAVLHLREALRMLDADQTDFVQKGPGFQERYLQSLGMLIHIAKSHGEPEEVDRIMARYGKKLRFVMKELQYTPKPLGEWEETVLSSCSGLEDHD
jgi:tetratricopeptide (TPR) repeat protein